MTIKTVWFSFVGLVTCGILMQDCKKPMAPNDVEAGIISVTAGCQFLKGITDNQTVIAICATLEEVAFIASLFTPFLDSFPDASSCTYILPERNLCLTDEQIGQGILAVVERRKARLLRD